MKRYDKLNAEEQARAFDKALNRLLQDVTEGLIRFNDSLNGDDLQARIDEAHAKAEAMRTPWFAHEYIMDTCREDLEGMARCEAEDSLYSQPGEFVVAGIAT